MKRTNQELIAGSSAHYTDPAYYTATYEDRREDVLYYFAHATAGGGPVLEIGVGNGRIALPIARGGVEIAGIDLSATMLADLRAVLRNEPAEVRRRLSIKRADMRKFQLKRRFRSVYCTFNTALHLYTRQDVEQFLACARAHLLPDGELVMDLSMPIAADLARDPNRAYRAPRFRHPTAGVVRYEERFDYDPPTQILYISSTFEPVNGAMPFMVPLAHSQFYPREWEALLHYNGFEVTALYGDFFGAPLDRYSDTMVWHAKKRKKT